MENLVPVKRVKCCDACGIPQPEDQLRPMRGVNGAREMGCEPCAVDVERNGSAG